MATETQRPAGLDDVLSNFRALIESTPDPHTRLELGDRLAAIGAVAAGLAHELNNPLTYVLGSLLRLEETLAQIAAMPALAAAGASARFASAQRALLEAKDGAERMHRALSHLRAYSTAAETQRGGADVREALDTALGLSGNELRHRAQVEVEIAEQLPLAAGSPASVTHLFLDLLLATARALPARDGNRVTIRAMAALGRVSVTVTSVSGPSAEIGRLFSASPATDPQAVAALRALATCRALAEGQGATFSADCSAPGRLVVSIQLSAAPREETSMSSAPNQPEAEPVSGRVLVIDDEPLVAAMIQRALEDDHRVVVVPTARHALSLIEGGERFDAIVSDLQMPDFSGMDLHQALMRLDPSLAARTLFLSGGAFTPEARAFVGRPDVRHMDKPFDTARLCSVVQDLVSRSSKR